MVHEYRPKAPTWIHFGHDRNVGLTEELEGGAPVLKFFIVPYLKHFAEEADRLRAQLAEDPSASLPSAHLRQQNAIYTGPVVTVREAYGVSSSSGVSELFRSAGVISPTSAPTNAVGSGPDLHAMTEEERRRFGR
jgi:hypothetical protein